jgi:hypothetical protein
MLQVLLLFSTTLDKLKIVWHPLILGIDLFGDRSGCQINLPLLGKNYPMCDTDLYMPTKNSWIPLPFLGVFQLVCSRKKLFQSA